MNKSKYAYFFEIDSEYVGYSYLSDNFVSFPIEKKKRVEEILKFPDDIVQMQMLLFIKNCVLKNV